MCEYEADVAGAFVEIFLYASQEVVGHGLDGFMASVAVLIDEIGTILLYSATCF